jgi:multiple sugar transport system permease protein/raffinose/stachyose/melibiose transport system permease protein
MASTATEAGQLAARARRGPDARRWWVPWAFLAVPLIMYLIWVIIPVIRTLLFSLTDYDGLTTPEFSGLENYAELLRDDVFWTSITNNVKWLVLFTLIPIPAGLFIAMLLDKNWTGSRLFKMLLYLPMTLSFVVIGQIWNWIYQPDFGVLNTFLTVIGLENLTQAWLSNPTLVTYSLIAAAIWRQIPYVMVLYIAGLKNVPTELVEAALVDGANWSQRFRHVVIPMLLPATVIAVTISIIDSLRAFDIVFVMTRGGPFNSSSVMANQMYIEAFNNYNMGYGAAIAVIQFIITFTFIAVYLNRVIKQEEGR